MVASIVAILCFTYISTNTTKQEHISLDVVIPDKNDVSFWAPWLRIKNREIVWHIAQREKHNLLVISQEDSQPPDRTPSPWTWSRYRKFMDGVNNVRLSLEPASRLCYWPCMFGKGRVY